MGSIASIQVAREPDQSLGVYAGQKALHVIGAEDSAQTKTTNPIGSILLPEQVGQIDLDRFAIDQKEFSELTSSVIAQLEPLARGGRPEAVKNTAKGFLSQIGGEASQSHSLQRKLHSAKLFVLHRATKAEGDALRSFHQSISGEELSAYLAGSAARLDQLKAEIIIKMILGTLPKEEDNAVARLRVEATLIALETAYGCSASDARATPENTAGDKLAQPGSDFVRAVAGAPITAPSFIFRARRRGSNSSDSNPAGDSGAANAAPPLKSDDPCDCKCEEAECLPPDPECVDLNYYVADLLELREETHCYEAGDLAYIENIAPRELRLRNHKFVKSIEDYSEEETSEKRTEERDHQVTDTSSVQTEISKQMSASLDVDAKVTGAYTGGTYTVDTSTSLSRDTAQNEAREKFREMVTRAVQTIQTETRKLKTRRVATESTETNEHTFDNKESDDAKVAKYFYVNQVKRGQVYSHGLRLMVDVLLPSTGALLAALEERKAKAGFELQAPEKPELSPSDIDPERKDKFPEWNTSQQTYSSLWEHIMDHYDLSDLPEPPEERPAKSPMVTDPYFKNTSPGSMTIPDGYRATKLEYAGGHANRAFGYRNATMELFVGSAMVRRRWIDSETHSPDSMNDTGTITVRTHHNGTNNDAFIKGKVHLTPIPTDYSEWQRIAHAAIMDKYEADLAAYEQALAEHRMRFREERKLMHPFVAEQHIRTQMKQAAIFMMCDNFDDHVMNMKTQPCGYPTPFRERSKNATSDWYFIDTIFDWELAEFKFYDYFRNPICKWYETFDIDEPNFLLKAFRQAGYARAQIPVKAGRDAEALDFLRDHIYWSGGSFDLIDADDPRYQSVATELKHSYGCNQNDRPGTVKAANGDNAITVRCSDFYWNGLTGDPETDMMRYDRDREIFIDGIAYQIVDVAYAGSQVDPDDATQQCHDWTITIDRPYEGDDSANLKHAVGAQAVGDTFYYKLPTPMVWLGDLLKDDGKPNNCLPCYPVEC